MSELDSLVSEFSQRLMLFIESQINERARASLDAVFEKGAGRRGRRPNTVALLPAATRKKPPRQLCPVPGCKNPAAPVFGMVCAKHKAVSKAQIKKYREARRAKKLKN